MNPEAPVIPTFFMTTFGARNLLLAARPRLNMPDSDSIDTRSIAPPPDLDGGLLSVTTAVAFADSPLAVELQVMPKVNIADAVAVAKGSVMIWLPLAALAPAQLSPEPPPVAVQSVALADAQVKVVDWPADMVVGEAESVAVTAGHVQTTEVTGSTAGTPGACNDAIKDFT